MATSDQPIAAKPVSATNPMGRRTAGKREWRLTIYELLDSSKALISILRSIRNKYPNDAETQRLIAQGNEEIAESVIKLNELLNYKDEVKTA